MKMHYLSVTLFILLIGSSISRAGEPANSSNDCEMVDAIKLMRITSGEKGEQLLSGIHSHLDKLKREAKSTFMEALRRHISDRSFQSPVPQSISLLILFNVCQSDVIDSLFTILDYQIDIKTIPVGYDMLGNQLYPAADALVKLRVDYLRILSYMSEETDSKRLHLAAWVLVQSLSAENAKQISGKLKFHNKSQIDLAIEKAINEGLPKTGL